MLEIEFNRPQQVRDVAPLTNPQLRLPRGTNRHLIKVTVRAIIQSGKYAYSLTVRCSETRDLCAERATSNFVGPVRLHHPAGSEHGRRRHLSLPVDHRRRPASGSPHRAVHLRRDRPQRARRVRYVGRFRWQNGEELMSAEDTRGAPTPRVLHRLKPADDQLQDAARPTAAASDQLLSASLRRSVAQPVIRASDFINIAHL